MPRTSAAASPRLRSLLHAGGCAVALLVATLATRPIVEMPFDDEFSYIATTKVLAETGHVVYNGWGAPILGWLLPYGALAIRVFGFSFTTMHFAGLLLGMLCAALMQRVLVRLGLREGEATFATLTLVLSLMFLPLAFSWMTDVAGMLVVLVCVSCCLRAVESETERAALGWVVAAAVLNAVGGTARQLAWLGVMVLVPTAIWMLRRSRLVLLGGSAAWVASMGFVVACLRWFKKRPGTVPMPLISGETLGALAQSVVRAVLVEAMYALPVLVAFMVVRGPRRWRVPLLALVGGVVGSVCVARWAPSYVAPFTLQEWLTTGGFEIGSVVGWSPVVLPHGLLLALTGVILATLLAVAAALWDAGREGGLRRWLGRPKVVLLLPFLVAFAGLSFTRAPIFTRYSMPLEMFLLAGLVRLYRSRNGDGLPWVSGAALVVFGLFTVAAVHDFDAQSRARLAAAEEMMRAGIPRDRFLAGVSYDGWTQTELKGVSNYYAGKRTFALPVQCVPWTTAVFPDIHPVVEVSHQPSEWMGCGAAPAGLEPVGYEAWLPPHRRAVYFVRMPEPVVTP